MSLLDSIGLHARAELSYGTNQIFGRDLLSCLGCVAVHACARCYGLLVNKLEIRIATVDLGRYISKVAEEAKISCKSQGLAIRVLREAKRKRVVAGKDLVGLAAAALYTACLRSGEKRTQKELAEAAGVTEVTLRTRCKALRARLRM